MDYILCAVCGFPVPMVIGVPFVKLRTGIGG
jgi:hypothetical protein